MAMKYYLYMIGKVVGSLRRVDLDPDVLILDRRDHRTRTWIPTPSMISITGLGSDADAFKEISKQEADRIIKKEEPPRRGGSPGREGG